MIYRLLNVEQDDFVASLLEELEYEIRNGENEKTRLENVVKSHKKTKGVEIQELVVQIANGYNMIEPIVESVLEGIIAAGLYDVIKGIVRRLSKTPDYASEKKIEIIQEDSEGHTCSLIITMREIVEKDGR